MKDLDEHRVLVQNHDVNMEALVRARNAFHEALAKCYVSGKEIDSQVVLVVENYKDKEQMIFIKELRNVHHG